MRNLVIFLMFASMTYGCTPTGVYKGVSISRELFCATTTPEGRAKIRAKQKLETNVCRDVIK